VLMINAGVGRPTATFAREGLDQTTLRQNYKTTLNTNMWGVIDGVQAFLPDLVKQKSDQSGTVPMPPSSQPSNTAPWFSVEKFELYQPSSMHESLQTVGQMFSSILLLLDSQMRRLHENLRLIEKKDKRARRTLDKKRNQRMPKIEDIESEEGFGHTGFEK
jgi:NAD(P)-dependent dehydrogenase (short-subunit alcohol dehydrogenase family)